MSDNLGNKLLPANNQAGERGTMPDDLLEEFGKLDFTFGVELPMPEWDFGTDDIPKLNICQVPYISDIRLYNAVGLAVLGQVETGDLSINFHYLILVLCMQLIDLDNTSFRFDKFKSQFGKAKSDLSVDLKHSVRVINAFADSLGLRRCDEYVSDNNNWRDGGECNASLRMKNLSELEHGLNVMFVMELRTFPLSNSVWSGIWNYLLAGQEESQRHQILQRTDRNDRMSKYVQLVQGDPYSTAVMIQSLCCLLVRCGCKSAKSLAFYLRGKLVETINRIYGLSINRCVWNLSDKAYTNMRHVFYDGGRFLTTVLLGLHNLDPESIGATEVANAIELRNYCFGEVYKFHGMKVLDLLLMAMTAFRKTAEEILETCRCGYTYESIIRISKFLRHIEEGPDMPRCWLYARAFHPNYFSFLRTKCHPGLITLLVELVRDKHPGIDKLVYVQPGDSEKATLVKFGKFVKSCPCFAHQSSVEKEGEEQTKFKKFAQLAFEEKSKTQ